MRSVPVLFLATAMVGCSTTESSTTSVASSEGSHAQSVERLKRIIGFQIVMPQPGIIKPQMKHVLRVYLRDAALTDADTGAKASIESVRRKIVTAGWLPLETELVICGPKDQAKDMIKFLMSKGRDTGCGLVSIVVFAGDTEELYPIWGQAI